MLKVLFVLFMFMFSLFADNSRKVVYDLTTGDISKFKQKVLSGIANNKGHYEGKLESLKVAVVIHGDAYKFFIKDLTTSPYAKDKKVAAVQADFHKRLRNLANYYEVEFLMCHSGVKHYKIKESNLYSFVKLTPNASIGLIDKQNDGFAYIPAR